MRVRRVGLGAMNCATVVARASISKVRGDRRRLLVPRGSRDVIDLPRRNPPDRHAVRHIETLIIDVSKRATFPCYHAAQTAFLSPYKISQVTSICHCSERCAVPMEPQLLVADLCAPPYPANSQLHLVHMTMRRTGRKCRSPSRTDPI